MPLYRPTDLLLDDQGIEAGDQLAGRQRRQASSTPRVSRNMGPATASMRLFRDRGILAGLPARAEALGRALAPLQAHPHVGEIRQRGLMVGIELVRDYPAPGVDHAAAREKTLARYAVVKGG